MRIMRALAVVLLLSGLVCCKGKPERVASMELAGDWRNEQGATVSFQPTGLVSFERPSPKARPASGEYTFDGQRVTLMFRPESRWCTGDEGVYGIRLEPGAFEATVVSDACQERERLMRGRWQRVEGRR